jgi:hypothetical protein
MDPKNDPHLPGTSGVGGAERAPTHADEAGKPDPAVPAAPAAPAPPTGPGFWARVVARPDPLTGLALTLPVFLFYHLGLLLIEPQRSDADLITGLMQRLLEQSKPAYIIATFGIALALSVLVWVQHKRKAAEQFSFARVLGESAALGFLLLITLGWATHRLAGGVALTAQSQLTPISKLVLACGTGFHEEIVFRVLLVTGGSVAFARLLKAPESVALGACVVLSSLIFGLSQFVGAFSVTFTFDTFMYRSLLGAAFAMTYLLRGFSVAVYTHVIYAALVYFVYS